MSTCALQLNTRVLHLNTRALHLSARASHRPPRKKNSAALRRDLARLVTGSRALIDDPVTRAELGRDQWMAAALPEIVAFPAHAREVAAILAYAERQAIPVTTRGAGYGSVGGSVPVRGGILLSTLRLNKLREVSATDFVAVTQPAVITRRLQKAVERKGLFYPPDPASLDHCSIGGNIATNAGGPRCLKYGVTRPYVLGLEVALADGTLVKVGGRTHKNKTGFDLVGLFVGSEGLLGVVTEATLRLLPLPPARATLSAGFKSMRHAAAAVQSIFRAGYLPCAVEVADSFTLQAARNADALRDHSVIPPGNAHLLVEIDGQSASVRGEGRALRDLLRKSGASQVDLGTTPGQCEKMWALRRAFSNSLKATGLIKLNEDIVVPRGRLVDLIAFAERLQKRSGFPIACFGHAGDGNIHVNVMVSAAQQAAEPERIDGVLDQLFTQVLEWKGAITGEHGIGLAKLPWWKEATSVELRDLHQRIKSSLDPRHILNPGKFV